MERFIAESLTSWSLKLSSNLAWVQWLPVCHSWASRCQPCHSPWTQPDIRLPSRVSTYRMMLKVTKVSKNNKKNYTLEFDSSSFKLTLYFCTRSTWLQIPEVIASSSPLPLTFLFCWGAWVVHSYYSSPPLMWPSCQTEIVTDLGGRRKSLQTPKILYWGFQIHYERCLCFGSFFKVRESREGATVTLWKWLAETFMQLMSELRKCTFIFSSLTAECVTRERAAVRGAFRHVSATGS